MRGSARVSPAAQPENVINRRLKSAIALAVVGAVVAEFVNADAGLGYLIQTATAFFKVELAWGALLILSVMGIVLFQAIVVIEKLLFPWSSTAKQPNV